MRPPLIGVSRIMFSGCPSVRLCVHRLSVHFFICSVSGGILMKLVTLITNQYIEMRPMTLGQRSRSASDDLKGCERGSSWINEGISTKPYTDSAYGNWLRFEGHGFKSQGHRRHLL